MTEMSLSMKQTHGCRQDLCLPRVRGVGGRMDWAFGISRCNLVCTGWINHKV